MREICRIPADLVVRSRNMKVLDFGVCHFYDDQVFFFLAKSRLNLKSKSC